MLNTVQKIKVKKDELDTVKSKAVSEIKGLFSVNNFMIQETVKHQKDLHFLRDCIESRVSYMREMSEPAIEYNSRHNKVQESQHKKNMSELQSSVNSLMGIMKDRMKACRANAEKKNETF